MKGLLIKDFKLLLLQKMFLVITGGVMLVLFFNNGGEQIGFVIAYATVMAAILTISSLAYDEMDNSMMFLLTLPTGRSTYVREKYVFGLLLMLGTCGGGLALGSAIQRFWWGGDLSEVLVTALVTLVLGALIIAVMIPVSLIFGTARCRVVIVAGVIVFYGLLYLGKQILASLHVNAAGLRDAVNAFFAQSMGMLLVEALLAATVLVGISYAVTAAYIRQKQF